MQGERLLGFPKSFVLSVTPRNPVLILLTFLLIHRGYIFFKGQIWDTKDVIFIYENQLIPIVINP